MGDVHAPRGLMNKQLLAGVLQRVGKRLPLMWSIDQIFEFDDTPSCNRSVVAFLLARAVPRVIKIKLRIDDSGSCTQRNHRLSKERNLQPSTWVRVHHYLHQVCSSTWVVRNCSPMVDGVVARGQRRENLTNVCRRNGQGDGQLGRAEEGTAGTCHIYIYVQCRKDLRTMMAGNSYPKCAFTGGSLNNTIRIVNYNICVD